MFGKKVIYGCESRGDHDSPYLTRFVLIGTPWFKVCLHIFHRSDNDELHDHPWPFISFILWRGYVEEIASRLALLRDTDWNHPGFVAWEKTQGLCLRKRAYPGMILFRRSRHAHRVELINGKSAVTLVLMGKRERDWGFFTREGWEHFESYFKERGC